MANTRNCEDCNKSGMAILPVRYAVVPHAVNATLPDGLGNKVKDISLVHHKYALRTLRQGYLYLYYEKHARGRHIRWEIFSVSQTGLLWKQLSAAAMQPYSDEVICALAGHNIPTSVIAIDTPEKCGRVWMAFSEHRWSSETFSMFEADAVLRDRRMQTFHPARWVAARSYSHGLDASEATIGAVLEYKEKPAWYPILATDVVPALSRADGSFSSNVLARQTTRHTLHSRHGQAARLVAEMKSIGRSLSAAANAPAVIALWDAAGITHELAGFTHDVLGWVDKYLAERAFQMNAMQHIESLKKALADGAVAAETSYQTTTFANTAVGQRNRDRRFGALRKTEPRRSQQLEVCAILEDWADKGLNYDLFEPALVDADMATEPNRSVYIKKVRTQAEQRPHRVRTRAWTKYEEKIDKPAYASFQRHYQSLHAAADKILNDRMGDLVAWLGSTALIDALTEFHMENVDDGVAFATLVGEVINGMNGSVQGAAKLDAWVNDLAADETNLLWRAVALNQKDMVAELRATLAEAQRYKQEQKLASTVEWTGYGAKSLKAFADTYKKFASVQNANTAAASAAGSSAAGIRIKPLNMHGADKLAVTAGDRIFKAFRVPGLADYASEKIIQHLFTMRAAVAAEDSLELIKVQAKHEGLARRQTRARLNAAKAFLALDTPEVRNVQSKALSEAWQNFKLKNAGAASSIRDARLAAVVMLIEGVNFSKLIADCAIKDDAKSWWSLAASGITISSLMFDVATVPIKALYGAESWSFQRLKLAGGMLGSAASIMTAVLDFRDAAKFTAKGEDGIALLCKVKGLLGFASGGLTIATTFTYAAPLIGRLTGSSALGAASRAIGARAAAIIGARILFMSAGAWLTVIMFGVQIFIWVMVDDELEDWCALCAFGVRRHDPNAYLTMQHQEMGLQKALIEIGLSDGSSEAALKETR